MNEKFAEETLKALRGMDKVAFYNDDDNDYVLMTMMTLMMMMMMMMMMRVVMRFSFRILRMCH